MKTGDITIKKKYKDQEIVKNFIEKQNEQRKIGKYCDYVLKSEDGVSFRVHKDVLELASPFFEKLFNSEIIGVNKESLVLKNCSSNVLENIIEFMYTGQIEIEQTSEFAKETLDVALFLGLNTLVDACTTILVGIVNVKNCFELLFYSETYHRGENLTNKCIKVIYENLNALKDSPEFLKLSSESMQKLVSYERNVVDDATKEEALYSIIVKWLTYDLKSREQLMSCFIDKINFDKICLQFGIEKILKNNCLLESKELILKIHDIISISWKKQITKNKSQTISPTEKKDSEVVEHNNFTVFYLVIAFLLLLLVSKYFDEEIKPPPPPPKSCFLF